MSKDFGELIKKKSINLCCQPIFSYISSLIIVPNAPFSQSLSHICRYVCQFVYGKPIQKYVCQNAWAELHGPNTRISRSVLGS